MNEDHVAIPNGKAGAIAQWQLLLRDQVALLEKPGAFHKALLQQAHSLHQAQLIDRGELSDLLELADAALAYAVESLIDCKDSE